MQPGMMSVDVGWCTIIIRGCGCVVRNVCVHSCLLCGGWGWRGGGGGVGNWGRKGVRACMYMYGMYVCIDQNTFQYLSFFLFFSFLLLSPVPKWGEKGI